ncbi:hypothetical protein CK203_087172 [Vitis vinifera]|uniref:Uncharacterized protein n=1 Tax=Vitis vinifera TaxID=29760 RepID=A0A438BRV7_VITVI|nr:hypothetical protein CK203_087172 [Vitis vinifera]
MQNQHTAILSQIQQHLGYHIEQTMPHEETTIEPSSPHDPPTIT